MHPGPSTSLRAAAATVALLLPVVTSCSGGGSSSHGSSSIGLAPISTAVGPTVAVPVSASSAAATSSSAVATTSGTSTLPTSSVPSSTTASAGASAAGTTAPSGATAIPRASGTLSSTILRASSSVARVLGLTFLARDVDTRKQKYLVDSATGTPFPGHGEGVFTQIARCATNIGPFSRAACEDTFQHLEQRKDTADFGLNGILRLLYLHGQNPMVPQDVKDRARRALLNFKYWIDEPGKDTMCFWSENHQILFATGEYLAGQLYPNDVFPNARMTGAQHRDKARPRILRWLDLRMKFGFSEWYSPVYYEEDLLPLFNLVDFAREPEIRDRAAIVIDLLMFDLARLNFRGSFGVTAGRAYEEHKFSGWGQSVGDSMEILFGTRGRFGGRNSYAATSLATSRGWKVPTALVAIGRDTPARFYARERSGFSFAEAGAAGLGFGSYEDGIVWWGMGGYVAKDTIVLSRKMINHWDLWRYPELNDIFGKIKWIPDFLLPAASNTLSPITEGSVLSTANTTTYRTPDGMLSSVQSFRKGQIGFQAHAWQATLGMDANVWTTAPGNRGHDGPTAWTGSSSLPRVVQAENVAVILYNPGLAQQLMFSHKTHAWFPKAAFDEVVTRGNWSFGRKGDGYVALFSARAPRWETTGPSAGKEITADGSQNAWVCQIGRKALDGTFAQFVAKVSAARLSVNGLAVRYDAPGLGELAVSWDGTPTLRGAPHQDGGFGRFENNYVTAPLGARRYEIKGAGARLAHDLDLATRAGDGL